MIVFNLPYLHHHFKRTNKTLIQMANYMLGLGSQFPTFSKTAVVSLEQGKEFATITSEDHKKDGKWLVMFWWPKDFTFVCPTEIAEFNRRAGDFADRDASLIGASTDSEFVHAAWRRDHDDLRGLKFPMLADTSKSLAEELGILTEGEKVAVLLTSQTKTVSSVGLQPMIFQ